MFTVHVISDLFLKFNEFTPESEKKLPDVDVVILNGNLAYSSKRAMLYVEELCSLYPTTQFIYNYGFSEMFPVGLIPKSSYGDDVSEFVNAVFVRINLNTDWPKNLHFLHRNSKRIVLRNHHVLDIFCTFGYPKIIRYNGEWEDTVWYKNVIMDVTTDITDPRVILPNDTSRVCHGDIPIWATQQYINEQNEKDFKKIREWELTYDENSGFKVLVTHMNPVKDSRCTGQVVDFFNIHLDKGLWIGSDTYVNNLMYLGAKFVSNPGRGEKARSLVITADRK